MSANVVVTGVVLLAALVVSVKIASVLLGNARDLMAVGATSAALNAQVGAVGALLVTATGSVAVMVAGGVLHVWSGAVGLLAQVLPLLGL